MPVKRVTKTLQVKSYDLGITIKKLIIEAAMVGAISALIYLADVGIPGLVVDNQQQLSRCYVRVLIFALLPSAQKVKARAFA